MENKKYYWLKLKQDFFSNLRMKKLRSIAGGDTYTIIYLKLQLLSLQNDGYLYFEGVEDTFEQEMALSIDENIEDVKITINFLISNHLVEEVELGKYELIETRTCIGSETSKAEMMRKLREKRKEKIESSNNVTNMLPSVTKCYTEIEKEIELEKEIEIDKKKKRFTPPTLDEVIQYCNERNNNIDAEHFIDYYTSNGWKVGKNQMKDWKATIRTWEKNNYSNNNKSKPLDFAELGKEMEEKGW